jgi:hypothetical protein
MGRLCYLPPVPLAGISGVKCPPRNYAAGMARVFGVMVQIAGHIRVSGYKFKKHLKFSHDAGTLKGAHEQCRVTNVQRSREFIMLQTLLGEHWSGVRV